jgi:DNA-binding LacI/PurR family transcriptional regulator
MKPFCRLSTSEQLADHLRRQIESGTLSGVMPGVQQLVKSLGVNSVAVGKAVQQLEHEGLVLYQGDRKSRTVAENAIRKPGSLRIGMLFYETSDARRFDVLAIKQELMKMGHSVFSCPKSMLELGRDVDRIRRHVSSLEADAWLIVAGSGPVLKWFEQQGKPAFALHGRYNQADLASIVIRKTPVILALIAKLVGLGHRRIVLLTREERRKPMLGQLERVFLDELEAHGIQTGNFNVPDWEDTPEGLERMIRSLFRATPPTALLVGDSTLFHATQLHLASRGILAPRDVSLFCNDFEQSFRWVRPQVSHVVWDHRPAVRRIVKWANLVSEGRKDTRKSFIKARLYEGGTVGPAKQGK